MPGLDEFQVVRRRRPARRRRIIPLLPGEILDAPEINTELLIRYVPINKLIFHHINNTD